MGVAYRGTEMWKGAAVIVLVLAVPVGWLLLLDRWYESVVPGGGTLSGVLAKLPEPQERRVFPQDGREYLALFGTAEPFPKFPSGPPVYIFDSTGRLTDWTPDIGDDEAFKRRWFALSGGRAVTQDEVVRWPDGGQ